jgi:hypothetical protein
MASMSIVLVPPFGCPSVIEPDGTETVQLAAIAALPVADESCKPESLIGGETVTDAAAPNTPGVASQFTAKPSTEIVAPELAVSTHATSVPAKYEAGLGGALKKTRA